ncbi:MAG: LysE family transporter [Desulfobacter sp.]|nr:LysE family transporter [Desulfobacter sp.]WDP87580.1 MAG: LysE family transporter [Desulfobacter sp.]
MSHYLLMGLILGLSAGLSPGPLLALVISETLSRGLKAGIWVGFAPLVSDLPIFALALLGLSQVSDFNWVLGLISLLGGAVILKMGVSGLGAQATVLDTKNHGGTSFYKGVMVNLLSPHPYLFWISVGGPAATRAWELTPLAGVGFVATFYAMLVGSKVGLALMVARSRSFLMGKMYVFTMRFLGLMLCILSFVLIWEGLGFFGLKFDL